MNNISGLLCSKCERPLARPFSALVFKSDGEELEIKDEAYPATAAVVVYIHKACKLPGHFTNTNTGRNGKMTYARRKCGVRHTENMSTADNLRGMGFEVAARDNRILMVLPSRLFGQ